MQAILSWFQTPKENLNVTALKQNSFKNLVMFESLLSKKINQMHSLSI